MIYLFFQSIGDGSPKLNIAFTGTYVRFEVAESSGRNFRAVTSDGQTRVFNVSADINFPAVAPRSIALYTDYPESVIDLRIYQGDVTGTGAVNGVNTMDVSVFPNLINLLFSGASFNKLIGAAAGQTYFGLNAQRGNLDLSEYTAVALYMSGCFISSLNWPLPEKLRILRMSNNTLGGDIIIPAYPVLEQLDLSYQHGGGATNTVVDVSGCPQLTILDIGFGKTRSLLYHPNIVNTLVNIGLQRCYFSARPELGGNFAALLNLLQTAKALTNVDFDRSPFSESEINQIVNAFYVTRNSRPAARISLTGQDDNYYYPSLEYIHSFGCNAPVISAATVSQIAALKALGWSIAFHWPYLFFESVSATSTRMTYRGTADIDIWAVGSTVNLPAGLNDIPAGNYTITAGAGKVWYINAPFTTSNVDRNIAIVRPG